MNDLMLSNDLPQIEYEIRNHKAKIGESIWEIGRRLKHVKENDLAHGQFLSWVESVGIAKNEAQKYIKIVNELNPNYETFNNLGLSALYLIATLPDDQKAEQLERIEQGDNPTVRELQELKRENNRLKAEIETKTEQNERLAEQALSKEVIEKEVVVEKVPDDYTSTKQLNKSLLDKNKELQRTVDDALEHEDYLKKQIQSLQAEREEVNQKSAKYDELTEAIKQAEGQINQYQKKIASYKNIMTLLGNGDKLLMEMGGLIYADETHFINRDGLIKAEFNSLVDRGLKLFNDLDSKRKDADILEGEIL